MIPIALLLIFCACIGFGLLIGIAWGYFSSRAISAKEVRNVLYPKGEDDE